MDSENIRRSDTVTVINTGGRVVKIPSSDVPAKKAEGFKIVVNPTRSYYPEFDLRNKNRDTTSVNIEDDLDEMNILRFEDI